MAKTKIDPKNIVKVGRLRQVTDSLNKDSDIDMKLSNKLKNEAKYNLIPTSQKAKEYTEQAKTYSDRAQEKAKNAKRYGEMINKAKAAAAKSKK